MLTVRLDQSFSAAACSGIHFRLLQESEKGAASGFRLNSGKETMCGLGSKKRKRCAASFHCTTSIPSSIHSLVAGRWPPQFRPVYKHGGGSLIPSNPTQSNVCPPLKILLPLPAAVLLPLFPLRFGSISVEPCPVSLSRHLKQLRYPSIHVRRRHHLRLHPGAPAPGVHRRPLARRRPPFRRPQHRPRQSAAREAGAEERVPRHPAAAVGEVGGGDPRPRQGRPRLARHLPVRRGRRARLRPRRAAHQGRQGQGQLPQRNPRRRARAPGLVHDGGCSAGGRAPFPQDRGGGGGVRARGVLLRGGEGALRGADGVRELHELPRGPLHGGRGRGRPCRRRCRRRGGAGRALELRGQLLPGASGALIGPWSW